MSEGARTRGWWDTDQGKAAETRLRAWADYKLHGGGLTFPTNGNGNAKQGKPGDLPAVALMAMDVDLTINEWGKGKVEAMILHVYGADLRPETLEDPRVDLVINGFFPPDIDANAQVIDRARRTFVNSVLSSFARFMANRRGL